MEICSHMMVNMEETVQDTDVTAMRKIMEEAAGEAAAVVSVRF